MKKAFTLAEVLITLTIVGTIAVLTIPQVMQDYKYKLYTTQLKRVYSDVSNAVEIAKNEEHTDNFYETKGFSSTSDENHGARYFLETYLRPIKSYACGDDMICPTVDPAPSPDLVYETMEGELIGSAEDGNMGLFGQHCIQSKAGATVCGGFDSDNNVFTITTDVNGINAPNTTGRDVFTMFIGPDGLIYEPEPEEGGAPCGEEADFFGGSAAQYAVGCLTEIMDHDWSMEY